MNCAYVWFKYHVRIHDITRVRKDGMIVPIWFEFYFTAVPSSMHT
jgi:hypothetical protein